MKRIDDDFRPLIGPAIAAAIAAVLLAVTWQLASGWLAERSDTFRRARTDLTQAASRYRNASDDQEVYEQYAARFLAMRDRGWIGSEHRLEWIETLQRINSDLRLPRLGYEIGEQVAAAARRSHPGLELRRTPMVLQLGLLHEGDLVTLLERLSEEAQGLMSVTRCDMTRAQERVRLDAGATNVRAECALDWFILRMERRQDLASSAGASR